MAASSWCKPPVGTLKVNFDGAYFDCVYGGFGVVARDCNGSFVGALQVSILGNLEPCVIEIMAIQEALSW